MLTGSCLCGRVAYEVEADLAAIVHCHCETCRKAHGAAFSSIGAIPRAAFRWVRGAEQLGAYESSPGKIRRFCANCGSQMVAEREGQPNVSCGLAASTRPWRPSGNGTSGDPTGRAGTTPTRTTRPMRRERRVDAGVEEVVVAGGRYTHAHTFPPIALALRRLRAA
ncbi:MAG: GFA family protein [Pseudomonadota bacterium]